MCDPCRLYYLSGNQNDGIRFTFNTINKQPHSYPVVINTPGTVDTVGIATAGRLQKTEVLLGGTEWNEEDVAVD